MRKIIASIIMMVSAVCLLTGCAAKRSLTITLDDSCKDAEAFVTVCDKNGKDMGGGNVMSNGPLMVSVNDGTYTVKVTEITGDGYEIPEPAEVTVKGDTQYKIVLTEKSAADVQTGMPNPVVEYSSLEEINEVAGVNLMKPPVMGVSDERFSVIGGRIAQYICDINGMEWTFRGACITDEDISGIYDERNVFTPNEDYGLYANEFYLDRFFDGDRQYTIVVANPISEDGEILIDEETYSNCCMEMKSILKQHMDDPLVGDYQNTTDDRMVLYVERQGDKYVMSVNLNVSDREFKCWTMLDAVMEDDKLTYKGEEIGEYIYDEDGNETSSNVTAANNIGYFEIKDDKLYWTGAAQEECRSSIFEKIVYSEENDIAENSEDEIQIEEIPERGDVLFDEKEKAYADIIDLHKKAIAENWEAGDYDAHDMSFMFRHCKSEEDVGFKLMYFDDSKYPMLLMGTMTGDEFSDMMILDAYYLHEDGQMDHILTSGERYRYYWMPDEAGPQLIAYEGSSSASTGYNYYYIVDNGKLKCVQGIVYDSDADPENPNYQVYEANFSIEGGEPVSEEYAREITEAYAKQYRKVPYRPISEGYDFIAE